MIPYKFEVSGRAADEQTWMITDAIRMEKRGMFAELLDKVMALTFQRLTEGRAIFGKPGLGCKGPYSIEVFHVEELKR